MNPISQALHMLGNPKQRAGLLTALEARIRQDVRERRHFAAAAGRVYNLSGQAALLQAVRNYLIALGEQPEGRTDMLVFVTQTVLGAGVLPSPAARMPAARAL